MTVTILNTLEAKEQFADLVNRVAHSKEHVVLTRRGKEIAVIIPIEDLAVLQHSQDSHDLYEAIEALKEARNIGTITLQKLKEDINL